MNNFGVLMSFKSIYFKVHVFLLLTSWVNRLHWSLLLQSLFIFLPLKILQGFSTTQNQKIFFSGVILNTIHKKLFTFSSWFRSSSSWTNCLPLQQLKTSFWRQLILSQKCSIQHLLNQLVFSSLIQTLSCSFALGNEKSFALFVVWDSAVFFQEVNFYSWEYSGFQQNLFPSQCLLWAFSDEKSDWCADFTERNRTCR